MDPPRIHCKICAASFSRRCHYERHLYTHTDTKPYACLECGQRFSRVDSLCRHENAIHFLKPKLGKKGNYKPPIRNAPVTIGDRALQDGAPSLPCPRENITQPCPGMSSPAIIADVANRESTSPDPTPTDESLGQITNDSGCFSTADLLSWASTPQSTFNERPSATRTLPQKNGYGYQALAGKEAIVEWQKYVPLSLDGDEELESFYALDLLLEVERWYSLVNDGSVGP
ncbi:hypothetical protein BJX66DRAFT_337036 [Aspergillus keveii]|uniref:C2H2-type domain-containing protein n=1 Tax=Aspergillus keveii TaxID=714993 RepID=A0ABR4G8D1_9EURO